MGKLISRLTQSKTRGTGVIIHRQGTEGLDEEVFTQLLCEIPSDRNELFKYVLVEPDSDDPGLNVDRQLLLKLAKHVNPFWQGEEADMSRFSVLGDEYDMNKYKYRIRVFKFILYYFVKTFKYDYELMQNKIFNNISERGICGS
mmetsp:Transcript_16199/g.19309  ORF Transcript_16199/g.19309 Transcript_16199/m.19309 type:complete len:144 (+) Transcript_16199:303-734(+)